MYYMKTNTLTIRLDKDLDDLLTKASKRSGKNKSEIAREALRRQLRLERFEELITRAKTYAKQSGKSVSRLVADFFSLLSPDDEEEPSKTTPKITSLHGLLRDATVDFEDYKKHIEQKYL